MNYLDFEYELYSQIFEQGTPIWLSKDYSKIINPFDMEKSGSKFLSYKIKAFFDVSNISGIESELLTLQNLYMNYYKGNKHKTKRFPERFPTFFDSHGQQIQQGMVRYENAYASTKVTNIDLLYPIGTRTRKQLKEIEPELKALNLQLFKKCITEEDSSIPFDEYQYYCSLRKKNLIEEFGENTQIRKKTGKRFKATFHTETETIQSKAGFFLFNNSFEVKEIDFPLRKRKSMHKKLIIPGFEHIEIIANS